MGGRGEEKRRQGRQERMTTKMMMMMMMLKCMATLDTGNWTPRDIETWLIEYAATSSRKRAREREGKKKSRSARESERLAKATINHGAGKKAWANGKQVKQKAN